MPSAQSDGKSGQFLPEFELYVALAISQLGDNAYGTSIRKEIDERTARPVSVGALYTTLARLAEKGLVVQEPRDKQQSQRGRPRKYCRLTRAGESALAHSTQMLGRMMEGLSLAGGANS